MAPGCTVDDRRAVCPPRLVRGTPGRARLGLAIYWHYPERHLPFEGARGARPSSQGRGCCSGAAT